MFLRRWFIACCCLLGGLLLPGVVRAQATQRQSFTTDDGLPQNSVHAVLQARDGYLWVATEGGVARFNGVRFERFDTRTTSAITSNDACCLEQTRDGAVWIGTSDGLVRWYAGEFTRAAAQAVTALAAEPSGDLLALTSDGVRRLSGTRSEAVPLPDGLEPSALGAAADGTVLVASGTILLRERDGALQLARRLPAPPLEVLEDGARNLWLRSAADVVVLAGDAQHRWRVGKDLPGSRLLSLQLAGGAVLASTNRGAFWLNSSGTPAKPLTALPDTAVLSATVDREGDLWFGTDTVGLSVLRPRSIETVPSLASEAITSIAQTSDGALWAGTRDSGLRAISPAARPIPPALTHGLILSLAPGTQGDLWIGTPEGLDHWAGGRLTQATAADGLPDDFIRSVLPDGADAVWVGTRRGVAHWRVDHVDGTLTTADGLPSSVVGTMLRTRDGTLWLGTLRGLARVQGNRAVPVALIGGASADSITALAEAAGGTLLVGTHSGTLAYGTPGRLVAVQVAGVQGEIDALLPDGAGNLWLRTPAGVQRLLLADLLRCQTGEPCAPAVRSYGTQDGMPSIDSSSDGHPSAWRSSDGVLWFATRRGVARIDAAHLQVDRVPPPVVIERVQVDGASYSPDGPMRLGPGHRRFVFDYAALSLRAPLQVDYRFRLEGFDRQWIDAGNRRSAEYTNLQAGDFRLVVEARNADGTASTTPAVLHLHIAAPIYRRWWFYLLVVLFLLAVIYGAYRLNGRRVQREFDAVLQERNRIAREIHDTLAQDFVAVSLQLEVTAQLLKVKAVEAAQQQVDATRLLVRDGIRDARESIWALRAGQSAAALPARLREMVEKAPARPEQTLTVTGSYRALASSLEKETLRIAKEAVGNAVRHAAAASIAVTLVYLEDAVVLTVSDDGAGFDVVAGAARAGHYGLRGMRERAAAAGGTLEIQSRPGHGTTVELRLETGRAGDKGNEQDGSQNQGIDRR